MASELKNLIVLQTAIFIYPRIDVVQIAFMEIAEKLDTGSIIVKDDYVRELWMTT